MNIGLDWDGTCTSDLKTFKEIARLLRAAGHKVYIVTMRFPSERFLGIGITDEWRDSVDGVYFTSRFPKKPMMDAQGIQIHVWIDDNPRAINEDAATVFGGKTPEGTVVDTPHK